MAWKRALIASICRLTTTSPTPRMPATMAKPKEDPPEGSGERGEGHQRGEAVRARRQRCSRRALAGRAAQSEELADVAAVGVEGGGEGRAPPRATK